MRGFAVGGRPRRRDGNGLWAAGAGVATGGTPGVVARSGGGSVFEPTGFSGAGAVLRRFGDDVVRLGGDDWTRGWAAAAGVALVPPASAELAAALWVELSVAPVLGPEGVGGAAASDKGNGLATGGSPGFGLDPSRAGVSGFL